MVAAAAAAVAAAAMFAAAAAADHLIIMTGKAIYVSLCAAGWLSTMTEPHCSLAVTLITWYVHMPLLSQLLLRFPSAGFLCLCGSAEGFQ